MSLIWRSTNTKSVKYRPLNIVCISLPWNWKLIPVATCYHNIQTWNICRSVVASIVSPTEGLNTSPRHTEFSWQCLANANVESILPCIKICNINRVNFFTTILWSLSNSWYLVSSFPCQALVGSYSSRLFVTEEPLNTLPNYSVDAIWQIHDRNITDHR